MTSTEAAAVPLRKDAARNRQRILDAARELFAQRGLGVTLNDIAHHAGVGVGTVYRRFPDKAQLIEGLFEQRFEEILASMQEALDDADPWRGLVGFLHRTSALQSADRGLAELVTDPTSGLDRIARIRGRLLPMVEQLVRRAQDAGRLHADITPQDLPIAQLMTSAVIDAARELEPDLWRRYLAIMIRGMAARPDEEPPLTQPAPSSAEIPRLMSQARRPRR